MSFEHAYFENILHPRIHNSRYRPITPMCKSSVYLWNFAQKKASYERPFMQRFMGEGNAVLTDHERREIKSPQTKQSSTYNQPLTKKITDDHAQGRI